VPEIHFTTLEVDPKLHARIGLVVATLRLHGKRTTKRTFVEELILPGLEVLERELHIQPFQAEEERQDA